MVEWWWLLVMAGGCVLAALVLAFLSLQWFFKDWHW